MSKIYGGFLWALLACCAVAAGCDDDENDTAAGDADVDGDSDGDADGDTDGSGTSGIVGTWALKSVMQGNGKMRLTGFSNAVTAGLTTEILSLVTVEEADGNTVAKTLICDLSTALKPMNGVTAEITLPEAFFEGMKEESRPIDASGDGSVSLPQYIEVMGLDEANFDKAEDPMPEEMSGDKAGAALSDPDGDGSPGMTAHMKATAFGLRLDADLFTVERATTEMAGAYDDEDHISGLLTWGLEMVILGVKQQNMVEVVRLMQAPEISQGQDPAKSYFRMARLKSDSDCANVKVQASQLFSDSLYSN